MTEEPDRDEVRRRGISAYQGALEAIFAIIIGIGAGFWADRHFGTAPRWMIVGTVLGFGSFVLRLWRMRKLFEDAPPGTKRND